MTSPLRYPGGKTRARKILFAILREHFEIPQRILSPFFGGGSFELFLQQKTGATIFANDSCQRLINFWRHAQVFNETLCALVSGVEVTHETYAKYRKMRGKGIKEAAGYFLVNRCSFNSDVHSGGFSAYNSRKVLTPSAIARIRDVNLENVFFSNMDFEEFLAENEGFVFVDPPYVGTEKLYGGVFDHERLAKVLSKRHGPWMLCYNDCQFIRDLYSKFEILECTWKYSMSPRSGAEIVVLNK